MGRVLALRPEEFVPAEPYTPYLDGARAVAGSLEAAGRSVLRHGAS
jgi:hypothetical protein